MAPVLTQRPDILSELVELVAAENTVSQACYATLLRKKYLFFQDIRAQALRTLHALCLDKHRLHNVLNIMGANDQSRLLPSLVRRAAVAVHSGSSNPAFPPAFVEALLSFVSVAAASNTGTFSFILFANYFTYEFLGANQLTSGGVISSLVVLLLVERSDAAVPITQVSFVYITSCHPADLCRHYDLWN